MPPAVMALRIAWVGPGAAVHEEAAGSGEVVDVEAGQDQGQRR